MSKGHDYELTLKNAIIESTTEHVTAMRPDYSGNSKHSVADVRITVDKGARYGDGTIEDYYIEAKKRSGREGYRKTVMEGSSKGDSGLDELRGLVDDSPPWSVTKMMVKFDHREAVVFCAESLLAHLEDREQYDKAERHEVALTPADSISMVKPELDNWESSTAGTEDHLKLLYECQIGNYFMKEGYY